MRARLTVRLPMDEKRRLLEAAARRGLNASSLIREVIRREVASAAVCEFSPLIDFFGSVDCEPAVPTNSGIRRALSARK
jgi:hypothetical protein